MKRATHPSSHEARPATRREDRAATLPSRQGKARAVPGRSRATGAERAGDSPDHADRLAARWGQPRVDAPPARQKAARAPRLSITLRPDTRALVDRLAALNGTPAARVIAEVIEEAAPVLSRIADAIERVKEMNAEKSAAIRATLATAQAEAETTAATALALLERIGRIGAAPQVAAQQAPEDGDDPEDVISPPPRRPPPPSC